MGVIPKDPVYLVKFSQETLGPGHGFLWMLCTTVGCTSLSCPIQKIVLKEPENSVLSLPDGEGYYGPEAFAVQVKGVRGCAAGKALTSQYSLHHLSSPCSRFCIFATPIIKNHNLNHHILPENAVWSNT